MASVEDANEAFSWWSVLRHRSAAFSLRYEEELHLEDLIFALVSSIVGMIANSWNNLEITTTQQDHWKLFVRSESSDTGQLHTLTHLSTTSTLNDEGTILVTPVGNFYTS